jgi:hypothetical protein
MSQARAIFDRFDDSWPKVEFRIEKRIGRSGPEFIVTDRENFRVVCGASPFLTECEDLLRFEPPAI